jgi:tetratricopeptide (TPR) repeat protein
VHLFDPHTPYDAREGLFGERFRDRPYDAGIAYVDLQVGRLLRFLERQKLDARTIVVVLGDHGESLGEHEERTHGLTLYESTVHVPLIVRFPAVDAPAKRVSVPVSLIDVFPTVLAELKVPFVKAGTGRNLMPSVRGEEMPPFPLYIETDHPFGEGGWSPQRGLISDRWKYIRSPRPELYDLAKDPRELSNLADTQQEDVAQFEQLLTEREAGFERRAAVSLILSPADQRKFASLGYLGGNSSSGDPEKPLADIKDMISLYNEFSDATVLFVQGRFEESKKLLESVVDAAPEYHQAWLYLGTSYLELGDAAEARKALERSVEIAGDPTARIVLGRFYLDHQQPKLALEQLETAVEMRPKSITGHFFLGEALRKEGQPEKAREHYLQVLDLSPDFLPAQQALEALP